MDNVIAQVPSADWIGLSAAIAGSAATVASVVVALVIYLRTERRRLIDNLRVNAEALRGIFERIDRRLTNVTFLQASEQFRRRLDELVGDEKTNHTLAGLLLVPNIEVNIKRIISQSLNSLSSITEIDRNIQEYRELAIELGQLYPVSSFIVMKCLGVIEDTVEKWAGGRMYYEAINHEFLKDIADRIEISSNPYQVEIEDLSSLVDQLPMSFLTNVRQKNIDDSKIIVDVVARRLAEGDARALRRQSRSERRTFRDQVNEYSYLAQSLEAALKLNRDFFSRTEWDRVWEAKARLIDSTTKRG